MQKHMCIIFLVLTSTLSYAQTCNNNIVRSAPNSRYELLNGGTEVKDTRTGLVWQRCSLGQTWSGSNCTGTAATYSWANAMHTVENMSGGWRVPNVKELDSLVEQACDDSSINISIFPNTQSFYYWSSSPYAEYATGAWVVAFHSGFADYGYKPYAYHVRLVRSSQ